MGPAKKKKKKKFTEYCINKWTNGKTQQLYRIMKILKNYTLELKRIIIAMKNSLDWLHTVLEMTGGQIRDFKNRPIKIIHP